MSKHSISATITENLPRQREIPFSSNELRLSGYEWLIILAALVILACLVPGRWEHVEIFHPSGDCRIPYKLSNDYWMYNRYCRSVCSQNKTLIIGDSVVWGHYVSKDNTLSHYLNKRVSQDQFANMGVDGIHPVAIYGLLRYYGRDISGKNVILHLNFLWMSSKNHDLRTEKEFRFNHPKLVPQFVPDIACYTESYSKKISISVERCVPFLSWITHSKMTYFDNMDMPTWTLEHPYRNPLNAITLRLPLSDNSTQTERITWENRGLTQQDFSWVELENSLQWRFFQQSVNLLQARGNRIFVLVGPFNEHLLTEEGLRKYKHRLEQAETWLRKKGVLYYIPTVLPSDYYTDASHPLHEGYAMLAEHLCENESFTSFLPDLFAVRLESSL
ncbi:MAG: hypothetical protein ACYTF1_01195 [Planctomycetota bacterium]|jgi:hypothetical protein